MNRFAVTWVVPFCTVAWACAGEPREWLPGPSPLSFGVVVEGHLLSYQWEPKDIPEHRKTIALVRDLLMPAERWMAPRKGEKWEPKDVRWYWSDLESGDVRPLKAVKPDEAEALSRFGQIGLSKPHHAPHRWRLGPGYFFGSAGDDAAGMFSGLWLLLRIDFAVGNAPPKPPDAVPPAPHEVDDGPAKQVKEGRQTAQGRDSSRLEKPLPQPNRPVRVVWVRFHLSFLNDYAFRGRRYGRRFDFDFIAPSWDHAVFFGLVKHQITVWDLPLWKSPAERMTWKANGRQLATFAVPFCEPFHVAAADGAYFFVTDSGAVYVAEETNGEWKTRALWKELDRPIIAMVAQSDSTTAFVFGRDFYFELDHKIEPKPCEDITDGPAELGDPMRTVLECAKVLHHAGLLKDTQRTGATP